MFHSITWDTVLQITSSATDTVLLIPRIYVADDNGVLYVFDYGDSRLKSFGPDGKPRWTFGREGKGPGEFSTVVDIEIDARGNVWIMDAATSRATAISSDGTLRTMISMVSPHLVRDLIPLSDGGLLATNYTSDEHLVLAIDRRGGVVGRYDHPDPELGAAFHSTRQTYAVRGEKDSWLALFPFGDLFFVYDRATVRCRGVLVEGGDFPRTMPSGPPDVWAIAGALGDSLVYVLPKGETDHSLRILDVYDARDCGYLGSATLPGRFNALYMRNGTFFLETEDPAPSIIGLEALEKGWCLAGDC